MNTAQGACAYPYIPRYSNGLKTIVREAERSTCSQYLSLVLISLQVKLMQHAYWTQDLHFFVWEQFSLTF